MRNFRQCTGISFTDPVALPVYSNQRIHAQRVFAERAQRGKTSSGWFFGFKLHPVVNDLGEISSFCLTPGNVDDRTPVLQMVKQLFRKLFGDKGYLSEKLRRTLWDLSNLRLITKVRKNMKNRLMELSDRILLGRRAIIESIIDRLKNISQIEHFRHRSFTNFLVNVLCGLIAYCRRSAKPSLGLADFIPLSA